MAEDHYNAEPDRYHWERIVVDFGRPEVTCWCDWNECTDEVSMTYEGPAEVLLELGVATPDVLAKGKPGKTRRDADGDRVFLQRGKGWVRLTIRHKTIEYTTRLPAVGVAPLLERFRRAPAGGAA